MSSVTSKIEKDGAIVLNPNDSSLLISKIKKNKLNLYNKFKNFLKI